MKYKLIATDFDHTLADTPILPTKRAISAIKAFQEKGGIFTVVTGRMTHGIVSNLGEVTPNAPIVSYQGAEIYDVQKQQIVETWRIPTNNAIMLLKDLKSKFCPINLYCDGKLYLEKEYSFSRMYCDVNNINFNLVPDLVELVKENNYQPPKILATVSAEEAKELEKTLGEKYRGIFTITRSSATYLEFTDASVSKGNAVKRLAQLKNVPMEQVVCFGDSTNDISMIEQAGLGVAMGNAMPEVIACADMVAGNCENDGWAEFVEKNILID